MTELLASFLDAAGTQGPRIRQPLLAGAGPIALALTSGKACDNQKALTALELKGKVESGTRAGGHALSLLAAPLNVAILSELANGARSLGELRRDVGSPPQTTMRKHLRVLTEDGALARDGHHAFPGSVNYALARPGRELLDVADLLQVWLAASPAGYLPLGSVGARSATKALVEGWSTTLLRALSARASSLTELSKLISQLSYPSLERRLTAMRHAGQVEARPGHGRGRPYAVTDWSRHAAGPLAAAIHWERLNAPHATAPLTRIDSETLFLLAVPLLRLPPDVSGACRLAIEVANGTGPAVAGVVVRVEHGRVASCSARLEDAAAGWASGSAPAWLRAIVDWDSDRLEIGGDCRLARRLLDGLHDALFRGAPAPPNQLAKAQVP
jgi:DNA-binding HxlR family transcriptional regulator